MLTVIGIDGATWDVILPNLERLKTFKKILGSNEWKHGTIHLKWKPWSPSIWCSMFSGKSPEEHKHKDFVNENKELVKREDINVDFIWDILFKKGIDIRAMNVPFVIPPFNFRVDYEPVAGGLPIEEEELKEEITSVKEKSLEVLKEKPEIFITVFTALDRLSHLHWGEPILVDYYSMVDEAIGEIIELSDKVIIVSDHGFCDYDKAPIQTLPKETPRGEIKGDHHPDAIWLCKGIDEEIKDPRDIFRILMKMYG